jgi:two-component system LytT family response regulator
MPYKAIIVEDEAPARRLLHELLSAYGDLVELSGEAITGAGAIRLINELRPELVFLDIQLPDMLGMEVLKGLDYDPYVIFTTAFDEYAINAFDALSIDYLLKPLKEDRIARALNKLKQFCGGGNPAGDVRGKWGKLEMLVAEAGAGAKGVSAGAVEGSRAAGPDGVRAVTAGVRAVAAGAKTLSVKKGAKFTLVQLSDIVYFEASDKYTYVHTATGQKLFCDHMLAVLEEKLSDDFVRVQKSYIVNRQKVMEIHKYSNNRFALVMRDREFTRIVTGPSYFPVIRQVFEV